ncbi:hypothetical protein [Streptosporangium lutulentum]|uniref:Uncharacterized protein n=1 Tax=Streptosporangium lutulentum TaxID=1461250 RepID=A0ABT9QUQ0_9ACTN|nr:hypothetical protein [Streptosporangium lutulentum]MDP9850487.1 hypothetical protein [Streptosporangium lutulentum]
MRPKRSRSRGIATGLTALAFVTAAAAPASATASTRPVAHQGVLASICDPGSGRRAYFSYDQWSKGNAGLCADVVQRSDGGKAIQVTFRADFYYYWGAAWYSDGTCIYGCSLSGHFTLDKNGGTAHGDISESLNGNSGTATHTFNVDSGHYQLTAVVRKEGGYWRNQGNQHSSSSVVQMNTLKVDVDVP